MKGTILIADDEPRIRRILSLLLQEEGYEVRLATNGAEAVKAATTHAPDILLLDQQMPLMNGLEAFQKIRAARPEQTAILMTAFGTISLAVEAVKNGMYDFIEKPFDNDELLLKVQRALEHSRLKGEVSQLRQRLGEEERPIVGSEGGLRRVMEQVERVARTEATVLIHGESGTGKELVARAIHQRSNRKEKPFVAVNCGAIPLSLIENELFGHEKGAFTDAKEAQPGIFEQAHGGTLFLDEVGELPADAQVKLLRVLEERCVTRIGGTRVLPVDVRIVAATNRHLETEVTAGRFRLDLLYRLNVFTLELPPLRQRREDIPLLAAYFVQKHNRLLQLSVRGFTPAAMDLLCAYHYPGNVRDLENAVQSAMILCPDGMLDVIHLPARLRNNHQPADKPSLQLPPQTTAAEEEVRSSANTDIREVGAQAEKELIEETLKRFFGNRTMTAEALGISRKTLFNKMKRYGIK